MSSGSNMCYWNVMGTELTCHQGFHSKETFNTHVQKHLVQDNRRPGDYVCYWQNCERSRTPFKHLYLLKNHVSSIHTKVRRYVCQVANCTKTYTQPDLYKAHKRRHDGVKPFKCRLGCDKTSRSSNDRIKHEQSVHSDKKRHKCSLCSKEYTERSSLRKHMKTSHYQCIKVVGNSEAEQSGTIVGNKPAKEPEQAGTSTPLNEDNAAPQPIDTLMSDVDGDYDDDTLSKDQTPAPDVESTSESSEPEETKNNTIKKEQQLMPRPKRKRP